MQLKKLLLVIVCILMPFSVMFAACDNTEEIKPVTEAKIELEYTDIHLLENDSVSVKIFVEPDIEDVPQILVNIPDSSCIESATIEVNDGIRVLKITSKSYIEGEGEVLDGAYIYFKDYDSEGNRKSFNITVHKTAVFLNAPTNITYDENFGTIDWNKEEGARYYEVNINEEKFTTSLTSFVLGEKFYGDRLRVKIRSLYDLDVRYPTFVDSDYSDVVKFVVLKKPEGLRHENGTIFWNKVNGASSYSLMVLTPSLFGGRQNEKIIRVDATNYEVQSYSEYAFSSSTTYTIRVKANGTEAGDYKIYGTQDSDPITVKKLYAPSEVSFSQGVLSWDNVEDNNGYSIEAIKTDAENNVSSSNYVSKTNYFVFDNFDGSIMPGQYRFNIKTLGNQVETLSGDDIQSVYTTKLNDVKNIVIKDGGIYWDKVEMASSYTIYLNSSAITLINDDSEFNTYFLGSDSVAGEYNIQVVACGDGKDYYNSNMGGVLTATRLNPTTLSLYNNKLSWNAVTGATSYTLFVNDEKIVVSGSTNYDLTDSMSAGEYEVKVIASGDGKISSEYSKTINFTKLATPQNLRVENGIVKWDKVEKSTTYTLKYSYTDFVGGRFVQSVKTMTTMNTNYDFKGEESGIYNLMVSAGGTENVVSSTYSEEIIAKKLITPDDPWVENGKLCFSDVNSGTLFVKIKETSQEAVASNFLPGSVNSLTLGLYVKGNSGENGENLISSGESGYLKVNVISSLTTPVIKDGYLVYIFPKGVTGLRLNYYKNGSLNSAKEIILNKEADSGEDDFKGTLAMNCYDLPELGAGEYDLKMMPLFPSATVQSVSAGGTAYIYGGLDMHLKFIQLDKPSEIGSYYLNSDGRNAITNGVSEEAFNDIINSNITNKYSGYLYWTEIKNATAYLIKINENNDMLKIIYPKDIVFTEGYCLYKLDGDFTTDMSGYNFSVKALGNESSHLSGGFSGTTLVNKVKLAKISGIKIKDGELIWDNISGAFYEINYNGNLAYTYTNHFALPGSAESGNYTIKIRALPKEEFYYAGEYEVRENVIKINSPLKYYISGGVVQWGVVNNASRYVININGYTQEFDIQDISFNLKDVIDSNDYFENKKGNFDIKLKVIGTEDSDKSQSQYVYLSSSPITISTTIMEAPDKMYVEQGVLTWTPVTGATKYALNFYYSEDSSNVNTVYINGISDGGGYGNKFSLGNGYRSGLYYFSVMALGDGESYLDSDMSSEYSAQKLSVVDNIRIYDGNLTFSDKAGASGYNAKINRFGSTQTFTESFKNNTFVLGDDYSAGKYQIRFQAIGNTTSPEKPGEICYLSSDYTGIVSGYSELTGNSINYVYKLNPSSNMYIANDAVNWNEVENSEGYNLKVDQTIIPLNITTSVELQSGNINGNYYHFSAGSFMVDVQTRGGEYFLNSSYTNSPLEVTKLDPVMNLGVEDGVISWSKLKFIPDNLALYINGEFKTNLRKDFFNGYKDGVGGVISDKTYYVLGQDYEPGNYTVHLVNAGGGETGYLSSDACDDIAVTKIESPQNLAINSALNAIVWQMQEQENTSIQYTINLYSAENDTLVHTFRTLDELSYVIHSLEVGKYYVRVGTIVKSSDKLLLNTDISDKLMVTMPAMPIGLTIANGKITWNTIEGVSGYNIEFSFYEGMATGLAGNEKQFRISLEGENQTNISIKDFSDFDSFVNLLGDGVFNTTLGKYKVRVNAFVSNSLQSDYTSYVGDDSSAGVNGYYFFKMFSGGKGTKDSPYKVTNFEHLKNVAYLPDLCFIQGADITTGGSAFTPIGTQNAKFTGIYNGDGKFIDDLRISVQDVEANGYMGMFGYVGSTGIVKNVTVLQSTISDGYYIGGIAGYNQGIIYNSAVKSGKISSETITSLITPKPIHIGGIAGFNDVGGIVDMCNFTGYVTSGATKTYITYSGGIVGYNQGLVCQCQTAPYNTETDYVKGVYSGGIVGFNINTITFTGDPVGSIYKCTNKLKVYGVSLKTSTTIPGFAGGIVGMDNPITGSDLCIASNYSVLGCACFADVICDPEGTGLVPYAGGIAGYAGNGIYSCYVVGSVYGLINDIVTTDVGTGTPTVNTGRIIGYKSGSNIQISYCYYNILEDSTLNAVLPESRTANRLNLVVNSNCIALSESDFKKASTSDSLNAGLIANSYSAIWHNTVGTYPAYTKVDRDFD